MQMRDLKTKLKYVRCLVKAESGELAKAVFEDMYIKKELCSGENCTVVYGHQERKVHSLECMWWV